jgi:hypothetical protein
MVRRRPVKNTSAVFATLFAVVLATAGLADAASLAGFADLPSHPGASGSHASGALRAELDHAQARAGEPVRLILRQSGEAAAPDLSPLEADFEIVGTQQSQRFEVVNGRAASSHDWIVTLLPRHKGTIEIPAIRAGDATSAPLQLVVSDAPPPPSRADAPDLFVEAEVDQTSPYVQGEVRYTARVFDGVGMLEGSLTEPTATDLRVTPLGEAKTYETTVNGRPYRVHEREYAMSPLKSGEIAIPALTLEARLPETRGRARDSRSGSLFAEMFGDDLDAGFPGGGFAQPFFDRFFDRGQVVRVRSNPVSLAVQARPGGAETGWFLPARKVELVESFAPANPTFRVGEVVRRTVALRALGAASEQLPRFEIPAASGVRVYDEGSRDGSAPSADGTLSIFERTVGILPTKAGAVELPAIQVEWFDVAAREKRVATLPARTIEIRPGLGEAAEATAPAAKTAPAAATAQTTVAEPATPQAAAATAAQVTTAVAAAPASERSPWLIPGIAGLAFAAGIGAALALRRRSFPRADATEGAAPAATPGTPRRLAREIRAACERDDARAAREALVRWAKASSPGAGSDVLTPQAIARRLGSARLGAALNELDRAIYSPAGGDWNGADLWQAFREASHAEETSSDEGDELRPLYPEPARA